jgi:hypothetical protein
MKPLINFLWNQSPLLNLEKKIPNSIIKTILNYFSNWSRLDSLLYVFINVCIIILACVTNLNPFDALDCSLEGLQCDIVMMVGCFLIFLIFLTFGADCFLG